MTLPPPVPEAVLAGALLASAPARASLDLLGLAGVLVFLAGVYLTWQARGTILYWLEFVVGTWRRALRYEDAPAASPPPPARAPGLHHLRLVGGFGLIFLGPLLVILAILF
jgi:hypothetical protein